MSAPVARSAGQQDHADPQRFRGEVADAPVDVGRPEDPADVAMRTAEIDPDTVLGPPAADPAPAVGSVRDCAASRTLLEAVNQRWPRRSTSGDGTRSLSPFPTRRTDHDAWMVVAGAGVRRARDFDVDGIDAGWLAEHLRRLGAADDPRLTNGGYVIFNGRITSGDWRTWRRYTGANPTVDHLHVSFSLSLPGFDSSAPWLLMEDYTVTPQELRAIVHGIFDTKIPLDKNGSRYTTLRQTVTRLDKAIVPVQSCTTSETHQLVEQVSTDLAALRNAMTALAGSSEHGQPPTEGVA